MKDIPTFSIDLVKKLDELFPERAPDPKDSEREIWMKAGRRSLVRDLVEAVRQQENEEYKEIL